MSVNKTPHAHAGASTRVLKLARLRPLLRSRDVAEMGIHTGELTRLTRSGELEKVGPGRYRLASKSPSSEHHDIVMATSAMPGGVVCLISALSFHGIGTQVPHQVWLTVRRGTRVPRLQVPPIRVVSVAPELFEVGVEVHHLEGQQVRVYSVARTVADCFRFRNTVGLDVALEALTEAWRNKRLKMDELNRIARKLRVKRTMQPYLETVVL
jgi:predicted transcriptional regulator of viral defense system